MTPNDEARELVDMFVEGLCEKLEMYNSEIEIGAKQCALICVGEKQETIDKMFNGYYTMPKEWQEEYDNLEKVKQEINKL